jgi:surface antigen
LGAFVAALMAGTSAMQPATAQTADSWNGQGGYYDNAPYPDYPYSGGAYDAPRDLQPGQNYGGQYYAPGDFDDQAYNLDAPQTSSANNGGFIEEPLDANYERERAAQAWRAKYETGYSPQAYPDYNVQPVSSDYAQADRDYYPEDEYYPQDNYYPRDDYYPQDDYYAYQRACQRQRANNQVGGLIFGAIAGGLFGNAISHRHHRGGATAMGAIMGGALGAGIAGNMDCGDHYYYRRAYYDGFQRGYPNRTYRWRNPNSGHYGDFRVGEYYQGPYGQNCATYTQSIWVRGRPERASGYACQRGDGSWEIVR